MKTPTSTYFVDVIERCPGQRDKTIKTTGPMTRWKAEKVRDGVQINLNRERFYVTVRRHRHKKSPDAS